MINQVKVEMESPPSPKFGTNEPKPHGAGLYGQSPHQFLKEAEKKPECSSEKPISMEELKKHNTSESAWISLKGIIYDVTTYISYHPGGDQLLQGCGKQSIDLFNKNHQWVNYKNILAKYQIGHLQ